MNQQAPPITLEDVLADFLFRISQSQIAVIIVVFVLAIWAIYRLELLVRKAAKTVRKLLGNPEEEKDTTKTLTPAEMLLQSIVSPVSHETMYRQARIQQLNEDYFLALEERINQLEGLLEKKVTDGSHPQSVQPRTIENRDGEIPKYHGQSVPYSIRTKLRKPTRYVSRRREIKG